MSSVSFCVLLIGQSARPLNVKYLARNESSISMISSVGVVRKSFGRWEHLFDQERTTAIISFALVFRPSVI